MQRKKAKTKLQLPSKDDIEPWNVEEERDDDNRKNEDEVEMSQIPNKGEYI